MKNKKSIILALINILVATLLIMSSVIIDYSSKIDSFCLVYSFSAVGLLVGTLYRQRTKLNLNRKTRLNILYVLLIALIISAVMFFIISDRNLSLFLIFIVMIFSGLFALIFIYKKDHS